MADRKMSGESEHRIKCMGFLVPLLVLLLCECFFFRNVLTTDLLFGDAGDGRFCTIVVEHWYQVLCGKHSMSDLGIFYPVQGTIAYSDMLLGYAPIYCLLRMFHLNMFVAYKWTLILIHMIGTCSMYGLLHRGLLVKRGWALIGTTAFSHAGSYGFIMLHTQLVIVSLVPLLLWFVVLFVKAMYRGNRSKKNLFAFFSITFFAALMYTGWYIAFFTILFAMFFIVMYLLVALATYKKDVCVMISTFFKKLGMDIVLYIVYGVAILLPFFSLYLPLLSSNGRSYWDTISYIPQPIDLFNMTSSNLCMGWMFDALRLGERSLTGEVWVGLSIVTWILLLGSAFWGIKKLPQKSAKKTILVATLLAVFLSFFVSMQIGEKGISLWRIIFKFVPGARSVRAIGRYWMFLLLPVSILIAVFGDTCSKNWSDRKRCLLLGVFFVLLYLSNIRTDAAVAVWHEEEQLNFLCEVPNPPEDCKAFFVINSAEADREWLYDHLDAMEIAAYYSLPTLNGYSGVFPEGYAMFDLGDENYLTLVDHWIQTHDLQDIYAYDLSQHSWIRYEDIDH